MSYDRRSWQKTICFAASYGSTLKKPGRTEFVRETRYVVLKDSDVVTDLDTEDLMHLDRICHKISAGRKARGKAALDTVVIEHDWPEFEPVWEMLARRCGHYQGEFAEPQRTAVARAIWARMREQTGQEDLELENLQDTHDVWAFADAALAAAS